MRWLRENPSKIDVLGKKKHFEFVCKSERRFLAQLMPKTPVNTAQYRGQPPKKPLSPSTFN